MKKYFLSNPKSILLLAIVLSIFPLLMIISKIWLGEFAFWYDPARDLLSALDNIHKLTLIGPTSGIPGVFYGPYWIWFLSIGTLFSHDPRIITLVVLTIPYVLLFPFLLSRLSSVLSPFVIALLWLLFILGCNNYFTDLWNPHLAPLLILLVIYLLFSLSHRWNMRNVLLAFCAGFTMGIMMNFQLSFGIGMLLGVIVYFIGENVVYFLHKKNKEISLIQTIILIGLFFLGSIISFAPYLLFELRHQFLQTKTLLNAFLHYGGVVSLHGLSQSEILFQFLDRMAKLIQLPPLVTGIGILLLIILSVLFYKKANNQLKTGEIKLLAIVGCITLGVAVIYFTAKNPIWDYHFIGIEVLYLLLLGILLNRTLLAQKVLAGWIIILIGITAFSFFSNVGHIHKMISGTLIAKQKVVQKVTSEGGSEPYTVFAYNPAIYMYDYSYLFGWMAQKDVPYRPELVPTDSKRVFVIIPPETSQNKENDFVGFRTPALDYTTTNQWILSDGTKILKREKLSSK